MFTFDLQSREHARRTHEILRKAHWEAYKLMGDDPDRIEAERATASAMKMVAEEAKKKFGNNARHPDCEYCLEVSVFGGPSHDGSSLCRSGGRSHCTCDLCF